MPSLRRIYQSDLLYVGPTGSNPATGALQSNAVWGNISGSIYNGTNYIAELFRIQKIDNGWNRKLKTLNQFGQLSQVDLVPIDPPEVTFSISYVQSSLANEDLMGFNVNKAGDSIVVGCLSGILTNQNVPKNYFVKSTLEGTDAINTNPNEYDVISYGNAFIASYSAQGRVLDFPTVDVSFSALNTQAQHLYQNLTGLQAITPARMVFLCSGYFTFASFNHFVLWVMGMSCNDASLLMHCVNCAFERRPERQKGFPNPGQACPLLLDFDTEPGCVSELVVLP